MKKPIRHFVFNAVAILVLSNVLPGISYGGTLGNLLLIALVISLLNLFVKPLLKLVLLPINVLTFGLAGWLIQIMILYGTTLLVPDFVIGDYSLGPATIFGIALPKVHFSGFWSYLGSSLVFSIVSNLLYWLL